jgi:hypothetical protein
MKKKLVAATAFAMFLGLSLAACSKKGPDGVKECEDLKKLVADCKGQNKSTYQETLKSNWDAWKDSDQKTLKDACTTTGDTWKEFCK